MKLRLFVDGAARGNPGPAGVGVVIQDGRGKTIAEIREFLGRATNNVAEYRALMRALQEARARGADEIEVRSDSDLLVRQINGSYRVRSPHLAPLHHEAQELLNAFRRWRVVFVPRSANATADALANQAIDAATKRASNPGPAVTAQAPTRPETGPKRMDLRAELRRLASELDGQIGIGVKSTWDGTTILVQPDRPFPTASVFKIPVLIELVLQAGEGRLSLDETVKVTEDLKSPGSGVLKELTSEPTLSLTDLAMLMIIISDNSATDILVNRVGT